MDVFLVGEGSGSYDLRKICLERDIRILGFVDPHRPVALRAQVPTLGLAEAAGRAFDYIILTNPQYADCHPQLLDLGVAPERILRFWEDIPGSLGRLGEAKRFVYRKRGTTDTYLLHEMQGRHLEDTRTGAFGPGEEALAATLLRLFRACQDGFEEADPVYRPGANWANFLQGTRGPLYEAVRTGDLRTLHGLLAHFWRNGLGEGIVGGEEVYRAFCQGRDEAVLAGLRPYLVALLEAFPASFDLADLDTPLTGNPFGLRLGGHLIQANSIMNRYRALYLASLVEDREHPVIAEVGGGAGFFAYALQKHAPGITYLDFDLPENLIVAAYYLASNFPERRILFHDDPHRPLTRDLIRQYDIILMANYMLPRLEADSVDLFLNTISFGEMSVPNVENYLREIERTTKTYLYHENHSELVYEFESYSTDFYRVPESFRRIFSAPSRWPFFGPTSRHHTFTENLYRKRASGA